MNPPRLPVRKRFPWILYWIVLVLIVLVAFAPVGSVVACGLIANAHGCRVDEGSVHSCVINGKARRELTEGGTRSRETRRRVRGASSSWLMAAGYP